MSELLVNTIKKADGTGSLTVPAESGTVVTTASPSLGRRNLIINGAMQVAQRATSVTGKTSSGYFTCDRWNVNIDTIGTWSFDQSSTVPSGEGFATSLKASCTTADASPATGDSIFIQHRIEGQNLQHLKKGTSNAEKVTLSFWVRSSKTGTHIVEIRDDINTRHIAKSYSITTADTWQYVTLTYDGDTSGTLTNSNIRAFDLNFWLGGGTNYTSGTLATSWASRTLANAAVGQVNLADTVGNAFYITGVQLEVGSVATPFEHRSYGEELAACQRYYWKGELSAGRTYMTNGANIPLGNGFTFPVTMRAIPTGTVLSNEHSLNSNSGALNELSKDGGIYRCNMSVGAGSVSRTDICDFEAEL